MDEHVRDLEVMAAHIRINVLKGLSAVGAGHIGGSMSMADILSVLYGDVMRVDPNKPDWKERDWLVVSKGHCGPAVYGALAARGFFPEEELYTVNQPGTRLPSHCDRNKTPGVDMTTGSLGQGMSTALGVAWGNRYNGIKNRTYLILGDGECDEGQVWEGALFAAQQKLSNLTAFVDCNEKQLDGYTREICDLGDLKQKFRDFGWNALECDGNDIKHLLETVKTANASTDRPSIIIAHTKKGKGCSFAEDVYYNHHMRFTPEQNAEAITRLKMEISKLMTEEN